MADASGLELVEQALGHRFSDRTLLEQGLTHASAEAGYSYERLEFLGDRVLGLVVAGLLLARFPDEDEGEIGRRFSALVQADTLSEIGGQLGLADHVRAASGVVNDSILADVVEALIAAIFEDAGMDVAAEFVRRHWELRIDAVTAPPQDPKTALQEWSQARARGLPSYHDIGREGPDHAPRFTVEVHVDGAEPVQATGASKRAAERDAAAIMLSMLDPESHG
ncbi:MAG: ribonuclease III [Alphaproteobacteria bacterium]|nr:ribonuclease III [Alphaproteobacteria bacterium]